MTGAGGDLAASRSGRHFSRRAGCAALAAVLLGTVAIGQDPAAESTPESAALQRVYDEVPGFAAVRVSLRHRVAHLTGSVGSLEAREEAARIAAAGADVLLVDNLLAVEPEPASAAARAAGEARTSADELIDEQLGAILAQVPALAGVEVTATAGVVHLTGTAPDRGAVDRAAQLAGSLGGVVYVDNRVRVETDPWQRLRPQWSRLVDTVREALTMLPLLAAAAAITAAAWWAGRWLSTRRRLLRRITRNELIAGILGPVVRTAAVGIGLYCALELLDATALVGAILGTAGVIGLALGFAFRDIVENYLASIMLSIRQPYRVKDLVQIDTWNGTVVRMTTRETLLMTAEGNHLRLPNAMVFKSVITNFTTNPLRRFSVSVGIGTDQDVQRAQRLGRDVLGEMAGVVAEPPPSAVVEELGDSSVKVVFYGWVDQSRASFVKVCSEATRLVKEVMDEHDVDMPEPSYRVVLGRATGGESADGRPRRARDDARQAAVALDDHLDRQVDAEIRRGSAEQDILGTVRADVSAAP